MNILETAFAHAISEYVSLLRPYSVNSRSVFAGGLKKTLTTKCTNAIQVNRNGFDFYLHKDNFYLALLVDIELSLTRSIVQLKNIVDAASVLSFCWSYVTSYYFGFFSATTFSRFFGRGYFYLDGAVSRSLSDILTLFSGEIVEMRGGNCQFRVVEMDEDSEVVRINIVQGVDHAHEATWNIAHNIIQTVLLPRSISYELIHFEHILDFFRRAYCPVSKIRNFINYELSQGMSAVNGEKHPEAVLSRDINANAIKWLSLDLNKESNKFSSSLYLFNFLHLYSSELYKRYLEANFATPMSKLRRQYFSMVDSFVVW